MHARIKDVHIKSSYTVRRIRVANKSPIKRLSETGGGSDNKQQLNLFKCGWHNSITSKLTSLARHHNDSSSSSNESFFLTVIQSNI